MRIFNVSSPEPGRWAPGEPEAMLAEFERMLAEFRPDVLLTYGGDAVAQAMIERAKLRGVTVAFGLHNFAYHDRRVFQHVDHVVVPSEFARAWYRERLGLECRVLPYVIQWSRVECRGSRAGKVSQSRDESRESRAGKAAPHPGPLPQGAREMTRDAQRLNASTSRRFVTFVNPQPTKGLFVFARIVEQLGWRRPDIPILVVESRGHASWLEELPLDLSWATNLHAMSNTPDPRDFYAVTKLLLVPSLWNESFGLVAAEAMINGIPVLASNRGALPETLGGRDSRVESRQGNPSPQPSPPRGEGAHSARSTLNAQRSTLNAPRLRMGSPQSSSSRTMSSSTRSCASKASRGTRASRTR